MKALSYKKTFVLRKVHGELDNALLPLLINTSVKELTRNHPERM